MDYTGIVYRHPAVHIQSLDDYRSTHVRSAVAQGTLLLIEHVIRAPVNVMATILSHDGKLFDALSPRGVGENSCRDEQCIQKIRRNAFKDSVHDLDQLILSPTIACINHRCAFNAVVRQHNVVFGDEDMVGVFAVVYATEPLDDGSEVFIMYEKGVGHGSWDFVCPCGMTESERDCIQSPSPPTCPVARTYIRDYISTSRFKKSLLFQTMALRGLYWRGEDDTWQVTPRYQRYIQGIIPGFDFEMAIRMHVRVCIDLIESYEY